MDHPRHRLSAIVEEKKRKSDFINATPIPKEKRRNEQIRSPVVVEVSLPNGCIADSSIDRKKRAPSLSIVVSTLQMRLSVIRRNYACAPETDGRSQIKGRAKVADLA